MKHTETFYAVELPSALKRRRRLAINVVNSAGPRLFYWRKGAVEYKNDLCARGHKPARVVRVKVSYHWNAKPL